MPPIDEPATFDKTAASETRRAKGSSPATDTSPDAELVAFTVDAGSGRIVAVERVDATGSRRELSDEEKSRFASDDSRKTLERVVEEAFEAGIDCVLGRDFAEADRPEAAEDAELSRALLRSLIDHSAAKRLMQREALGRAIVATLIERAASGADAKLPH